MKLRDRLEHLLTIASISRREVARLAGQASEAHVSMILRGRVGCPTQDTTEALAGVFGVPAGWLAFGEGPDPDPESVRAAVEAARTAAAPQVAA